jgi:hypothetical protein
MFYILKMVEYICDTCNNTYSSKFNLKRHQGKCNSEKKPFKCDCSKEYSSEKYFIEHKSKCSYLMLKEMKENIETIKNEQQRTKENKTVNINNYIQANFVIKGNVISPLDLSQSRFDRIVDNNYTYKVYEKNTVVRDVIIPYFLTDNGNPSAVITDKSRMTIKCVDMNNQIVTHDPKTIINMCVSSKPLEEKHSIYEEKYTKDIYGNPINIFVEDASYKTEMIKKHHIMKKHLYNYSNRFLQKKPKELEPLEANIRFIED